jgi:hypothetical protein
MKEKIGYIKGIIYKQLPYPLHLNLFSIFILLFGSLRLKVLYGTYRRVQYMYSIYEAAKRAKSIGLAGITIIEFGVASGRGIIAMIKYAEKVSKALNIEINIMGFDSGEGMPVLVDYRDHPEYYTHGDFPMFNRNRLIDMLPENAQIVFLDLIKDSWAKTNFKYPIGFIAVDVDYYSSTQSILKHLLEIDKEMLLPNILMYFDDVVLDNHNIYQGELLAIHEFNEIESLRKIESHSKILRHKRMFKNETWIDNMYQLHVMDHAYRQKPYRDEKSPVLVIKNKYIK